MKRFEIQHFTLCDGWVNTWTIENPDGTTSLEYFDSFGQALNYLDEFLTEDQEQFESPYQRDEFRIVEVL